MVIPGDETAAAVDPAPPPPEIVPPEEPLSPVDPTPRVVLQWIPDGSRYELFSER